MQIRVSIGRRQVTLDVVPGQGSAYTVELDGRVLSADLCQIGTNPLYSLLLDGASYQFFLQQAGEDDKLVLIMDGEVYPAQVLRGGSTAISVAAAPAMPAEQRVVAPLPGLVVKVLVAVGDQVDRHTALLVLESMKMNNPVRAPAAGQVKAVLVRQGQRVERGQVLAVLG